MTDEQKAFLYKYFQEKVKRDHDVLPRIISGLEYIKPLTRWDLLDFAE